MVPKYIYTQHHEITIFLIVSWKHVIQGKRNFLIEVGRVVQINYGSIVFSLMSAIVFSLMSARNISFIEGELAGKICVILDIVDQNRVRSLRLNLSR